MASHHHSFDHALARYLDQLALNAFLCWEDHTITSEQYEIALDALLSEADACPVLSRNLRMRLDQGHARRPRSLGEFALQIARQALPEIRDTRRWLAGQPCTRSALRYHGMESNGAVVFSPDRVHGDPDWLLDIEGSDLLPDGTHLVETKHAPSFDKMSFKLADLTRYHAAGAYILVFFGSYKTPNARLKWDLLEPERIAYLLDQPAICYEEFGGNKPAVRLDGYALRAFLNLRPL